MSNNSSWVISSLCVSLFQIIKQVIYLSKNYSIWISKTVYLHQLIPLFHDSIKLQLQHKLLDILLTVIVVYTALFYWIASFAHYDVIVFETFYVVCFIYIFFVYFSLYLHFKYWNERKTLLLLGTEACNSNGNLRIFVMFYLFVYFYLCVLNFAVLPIFFFFKRAEYVKPELLPSMFPILHWIALTRQIATIWICYWYFFCCWCSCGRSVLSMSWPFTVLIIY